MRRVCSGYHAAQYAAGSPQPFSLALALALDLAAAATPLAQGHMAGALAVAIAACTLGGGKWEAPGALAMCLLRALVLPVLTCTVADLARQTRCYCAVSLKRGLSALKAHPNGTGQPQEGR